MRKKFCELKSGETILTTVLLVSMSDIAGKNGNYVKISISDGTSELSVNKFSCYVDGLKSDGIEVGKLADVELTLKTNGFYEIKSIFPTRDLFLKVEDFVKTAPIDIDQEFDYILNTVKNAAVKDSFGNDRFSTVTEYILKKYEQDFKHSSAAKSMHHNYLGGLVQHTATMLKAAEKICEVYTDLDKELLICGVALHDIGKLFELETNETGVASYTIEGALLGHLWTGANLVENTYKEVFHKQITDEVMMLLHMIASHHGKPEYGTIVVPAFKEAYCLHALDMLDSRMQIYNNEYETLEPGHTGEKISYGLGTRVYRPANS